MLKTYLTPKDVALLLGVFDAGGAFAETDGVVCQVCISGGTLNIRDKAGLDGEVIGILYPDDSVTGIGYSGGWTHVLASIEAGEGWVKSEYLTTDADGAEQYVNGSGGRVRIRAGVGGKAVGWVKAGHTVAVTSWAIDEDGNDWAYIGSGWVMGAYLEACGHEEQ